MKVSIIRTHRFGKLLHQRDWDVPIPGAVQMFSMPHPALKRATDRLTLARHDQFGGSIAASIPDLQEPELIAFDSDRVMAVRGFEEIDGRRYYQTWRIMFEE
tara:strand:+ start:127 stop:432 length:306 start_codon:yes stop_codon:yes gene_type:complete